MKWMILSPHTQAGALRRRADRLAYAAETARDREPCRDVRAEINRLRERAGHADQQATVAEGIVVRLERA
jgi:hypothetical protein